MPFDATPIETKPAVFSLDGLIAWLETQDPETSYSFLSTSDCLLCRYLNAAGFPNVSLGGWGRAFSNNVFVGQFKFEDTAGPTVAGAGADVADMTFGAALTRAKRLRGY